MMSRIWSSLIMSMPSWDRWVVLPSSPPERPECSAVRRFSGSVRLAAMSEPLDAALAGLRPLLLDRQRLVRAVGAGRRRAARPTWRRVELRPVDLRSGRHLQVVTYDERQAHTRNLAYDGSEPEQVVAGLLAEPFGNWHVETTGETVQLRVTKTGAAQVHRSDAGPVAVATVRAHDRVKPRFVDPAEPFVQALGITDAEGRVKPSRQDKFRQVEEFVRVLDATLAGAPVAADRPLQVVDLGCGNAYLTLAAYAWLHDIRGLAVDLVGVDVRPAARARNTALADRLGWSERVRFVEGTILDAPVEAADVVLALHACDTATDEALARAVRWRAPLVLAAPCCHHDVARQLRSAAPPWPYALLTRHGVLRERFADTLTDALRAAVLRLLGYRVDVVEFVPSRHTPRNSLLRAVRTGAAAAPERVAEYDALVRAWHLRPELARLLAAELAAVPDGRS
jgi:SAM-dependent methyltransferase